MSLRCILLWSSEGDVCMRLQATVLYWDSGEIVKGELRHCSVMSFGVAPPAFPLEKCQWVCLQ